MNLWWWLFGLFVEVNSLKPSWFFNTICTTQQEVLEQAANVFDPNKRGNLDYFNRKGFRISYEDQSFLELQSLNELAYITSIRRIEPFGAISFYCFVASSATTNEVEVASRVEHLATLKLKKCRFKKIKLEHKPEVVMREWLSKFN